MVKMIIKINLSGYAKVIHIDIVNKVSQASSSPVADTNLLSFREFSKLLHINNTNKWKGLISQQGQQYNSYVNEIEKGLNILSVPSSVQVLCPSI